MPSPPIIVTPWPLAAATAEGAAAPNLLTSSPLEIVRADDATLAVTVDLGVLRQVDTIFLGFSNAADAGSVSITSGTTAYGQTARVSAHTFAPTRITPVRRHTLWRAVTPFSARYLSLTATATSASGLLEAGVFAAGLAWQPTYRHEWGSGRSLGDTGVRDRLKDGSFAVDLGTATPGWQWTLGDLSDTETDQLYAIARDRRQTRDVLVVEDPDQTAGLNERIHWGMFDRLETFERRDDGKTRWAFRMEDWA